MMKTRDIDQLVDMQQFYKSPSYMLIKLTNKLTKLPFESIKY